MESTAQYWRPVWEALERRWQPIRRHAAVAGPTSGALHLAQAQSNHGPRGRKKDFPDAERLVKRLVAHELTLSFVPDVTQRLWRTVTRRKYQSRAIGCSSRTGWSVCSRKRTSRCRVWSRISSDPARDACCARSRVAKRIPAAVVALGSPRLHATPDQLRDALGACTDLHPVYRRLLAMTLEELDVIETHIRQLDEELARLLRVHQEAVATASRVPGLVVDSAQQIIAEVGPTAATFATAKRLASWVGACPGDDESAGVNHSHRSPSGNRQMRRLLNQAATPP